MKRPDTHAGKLRALLVASPRTDLGFDRVMELPNLGLCSIAANVDPAVCEVKVLDLVAVRQRAEKHLRGVLEQYRPDVVGLSSMTFQYADTLALARVVKSVREDIVVVLGGYHATTCAEAILANAADMTCLDVLVRNEGEHAFERLTRALASGSSMRDVPNLSFLEDGVAVHTPSDAPLDLATINLPDRNARLLTRRFHLFGFPADVVETSRGCTHSCDFCSIRSMYGRGYRAYAVERVVRDIADARAHGAQAIFIADDNVALDGRRYKELCQAIIDAGLHRQRYFVQASVRGLSRTPGLIEAMAASGVRWVFLGIESSSEESLTFLDKSDQFTSDEVAAVVTGLRRRGVIVIGGFIIGNPDDTEETMLATFDYAKRLRVDVALFFILTPFPTTEARENLLREGLVTNPDDFTQYTCFKANVRTRHVSSERLYALREEMGYRFPIESGSVWRFLRELVAHPLHYTLRLGLRQLTRDPLEIVGYFKGLWRR
jgi:anaerobic magnesium-protoporphyrin IX monomethyl ester cyclase